MSNIANTLEAARLTLPTAVALAGVATTTAAQWTRRGVIVLGRRDGLFNRLVLDGFDLLRLTVMADLARTVAMPPGDAAKVAAVIETHARGDAAPGDVILLCQDATGEWVGRFDTIGAPGQPPFPGHTSHLIVPIGALIRRVAENIQTYTAAASPGAHAGGAISEPGFEPPAAVLATSKAGTPAPSTPPRQSGGITYPTGDVLT